MTTRSVIRGKENSDELTGVSLARSEPTENVRMLLDSAPLVSVIVPAYEAATYIAETVHAVLAQSFKDFELIVVNDGSPDTAELEAALAPFTESIVYRREPHRGAAAARNVALRAARGTYVA